VTNLTITARYRYRPLSEHLVSANNHQWPNAENCLYIKYLLLFSSDLSWTKLIEGLYAPKFQFQFSALAVQDFLHFRALYIIQNFGDSWKSTIRRSTTTSTAGSVQQEY